MFFLLYVLLLANIMYVTNFKFQTLLKPNILFSSIWCLTAGISSLGLANFYKPSVDVHFYSIVVIITFNIIYFIVPKLLKNKEEERSSSLRVSLILYINIISWVYLSGFLLFSWNIIITKGFNYLRLYAFDSSFGMASTNQLLIIQWFIQAIFYATILVTLAAFLLNVNYGKKTLIVIAGMDIIIYVVLFAGRTIMLNTVMYMILGFLLVNGTIFINHKLLIKVLIPIMIMFIAMMYVTKSRSWGSVGAYQNFLTYYVGPFTYLDKTLLGNNASDGLLYGKSTFGFIYNVLFAPFTYIFKIPYRGSDYFITQVTSVPRSISPTLKMNFSTTMIYPLLRDFGLFGLIFGTSFYSFVITTGEKLFSRRKDLKYLSIYLYLLGTITSSISTYPLLFPMHLVTILTILIFVKNE